MPKEIIFNLGTILALCPLTIMGFKQHSKQNSTFWILLGVATVGPLLMLIVKLAGTWHTDLTTSIWATMTATMILFTTIAMFTKESWKLAPLISGYMIFLGILASVSNDNQTGYLLQPGLSSIWLEIHIFISITTYALVTISAIASFSATYQEYSFKKKIKNSLNLMLPSVRDCDSLVVLLLTISETILGLGLISGIVVEYYTYDHLFSLNHKSILTVSAFVVIGMLLIAHFRIGLRGKRAARYVLSAYLLMTLGYPGVKFVTEILLG